MMRPGDSEWRGAAGLRGRAEEGEVDLLGEVVAELVEAVDVVFDAAMVASVAWGSRAASSRCQRSKLARCWSRTSWSKGVGRRGPGMSGRGRERGLVVQADDVGGGEHEVVSARITE